MRSRADEPAIGKPAILAACEDPGDMRRIERELRTRYEADYHIIFEGSVGAGLETLEHLVEAGDRVALVLADQQIRAMSGVESLARVREVRLTAKRLPLKKEIRRVEKERERLGVCARDRPIHTIFGPLP